MGRNMLKFGLDGSSRRHPLRPGDGRLVGGVRHGRMCPASGGGPAGGSGGGVGKDAAQWAGVPDAGRDPAGPRAAAAPAGGPDARPPLDGAGAVRPRPGRVAGRAPLRRRSRCWSGRSRSTRIVTSCTERWPTPTAGRWPYEDHSIARTGEGCRPGAGPPRRATGPGPAVPGQGRRQPRRWSTCAWRPRRREYQVRRRALAGGGPVPRPRPAAAGLRPGGAAAVREAAGPARQARPVAQRQPGLGVPDQRQALHPGRRPVPAAGGPAGRRWRPTARRCGDAGQGHDAQEAGLHARIVRVLLRDGSDRTRRWRRRRRRCGGAGPAANRSRYCARRAGPRAGPAGRRESWPGCTSRTRPTGPAAGSGRRAARRRAGRRRRRDVLARAAEQRPRRRHGRGASARSSAGRRRLAGAARLLIEADGPPAGRWPGKCGRPWTACSARRDAAGRARLTLLDLQTMPWPTAPKPPGSTPSGATRGGWPRRRAWRGRRWRGRSPPGPCSRRPSASNWGRSGRDPSRTRESQVRRTGQLCDAAELGGRRLPGGRDEGPGAARPRRRGRRRRRPGRRGPAVVGRGARPPAGDPAVRGRGFGRATAGAPAGPPPAPSPGVREVDPRTATRVRRLLPRLGDDGGFERLRAPADRRLPHVRRGPRRPCTTITWRRAFVRRRRRSPPPGATPTRRRSFPGSARPRRPAPGQPRRPGRGDPERPAGRVPRRARRSWPPADRFTG